MRREGRSLDDAVILALVLYSGSLLLFSYLFYRDMVWSILRTLSEPEYSYIAVIMFSLFVLGLLSLMEGLVRVTRSLPPIRVLLAALLVSLSILFFTVSEIALQYDVELKAISFLLLAWSFASVLFRFREASSFILVLTSMALVPLPASLLDSVSIWLSRFLGRLAARMLGAEYVSTPLGSYIYVAGPHGVSRLDVTLACSGIVSLSSILAVAPIIAYIVSRSSGSGFRKTIALAASLVVAVAAVLLGNLARIVLVAREVSKGATGQLLAVFHQAPSAIYVAVAILLAVIVAQRIAGGWRPVSRAEEPPGSWPSGVFVAFVGVVLFSVALFSLVASATPPSHLGGVSGNITSFTELASNPSIILTRANITVLHAAPDKRIAAILGETNVVSALIQYNGSRYQAYIELAESPTRFHSWSVCLGYQGYRILEKYSSIYNGQPVTVYHAVRGNTSYVVAFTVYKLAASFGPTFHPVYVKLTLLRRLAPGESLAVVAAEAAKLLGVIGLANGQRGVVYMERVEAATKATYYILGVLALYLAASYLYERMVRRGKTL